MIIDHYGINHSFEKEIKKQTKVKLFVLDDTYKKHYCDILLNHNIYAKAEKYINLLNKDCEIRCGEKHTLLRNEFFIEKKRPQKKKKYILIAMGGVDTRNLILKITNNILNNFELDIVIVTSNANSNIDKIKDRIKGNKKNKINNQY